MTPTLFVTLQVVRRMVARYETHIEDQLLELFHAGELETIGLSPDELSCAEFYNRACTAVLHAKFEQCAGILHQHMHSDGGYMPPSEPQWRVGHKIKPSSS